MSCWNKHLHMKLCICIILLMIESVSDFVKPLNSCFTHSGDRKFHKFISPYVRSILNVNIIVLKYQLLWGFFVCWGFVLVCFLFVLSFFIFCLFLFSFGFGEGVCLFGLVWFDLIFSPLFLVFEEELFFLWSYKILGVSKNDLFFKLAAVERCLRNLDSIMQKQCPYFALCQVPAFHAGVNVLY